MTEARLERLLAEHAGRHGVPGAAAAVLREGRITAAHVGETEAGSGVPITPDTRFAAGSIGKTMVAAALARLAAHGRVSLDDHLSAHVPELVRAPWARRATLRDVMASRARVPQSLALEFGAEGEGVDVIARRARAVATAEEGAPVWSYSNTGWCLLGRAIERIAGRTWEDAMRELLLDPAELEATSYASTDRTAPRATGHEIRAGRPEPVEAWTPRAYGPSGTTVLATVTDLARFARWLLQRTECASLRETQAEVSIHGWLDAWCLGMARFDWEGDTVYGWDGLVSGQRSFLRLLPGRHGAVALMANVGTGRALFRSLVDDLLEPFGVRSVPLRLTPAPGAAGDLARYEGTYAWPDRRYEVRVAGDGLAIESEEREILVLPAADRVFLVDAAEPDNPTLTFGPAGADGRPVALYRMLWGFPRES